MKKRYAGILAFICSLCFPVMTGLSCPDPVLASAESTVTENDTVVYDGLIYSLSGTEAVLQGCEDITAVSVTIPAEIDGKPVVFSLPAFRDCSSLERINVEENHATLCSMDGVLFTKNKKGLLEYPCAKAGEYCVPSETERVEYGAFQNCTGITSITLSSSPLLGAFAFRDCTSLTEVNGIARLEQGNVFIGCEKLTTLTIGHCVISELVLQNMKQLTAVDIFPNCTFEKLIVANCPVLTKLWINGTVSDPVSTESAVQLIGLPALKQLQLPVTVKMTDQIRLPRMVAEVRECGSIETITCGYTGSIVVSDCGSLTEMRFHENLSMDISVTSCENLAAVYGRSADAVLRKNCEQLGLSFISFEDSVHTGDVSADGEINIADLLRLNRAILIGEPLSSLSESLADYDGDGMITAADSLCILKATIGLTE